MINRICSRLSFVRAAFNGKIIASIRILALLVSSLINDRRYTSLGKMERKNKSLR